MRRVILEKASAGMVLAQPILGLEGQVVLNTGVALQEHHLQKLRDLQVQHLYIEENESDFIDEQDVEAQSRREKTVAQAHEILENIKVGKYVETQPIKDQVIDLLDELCQRKDMQPVFQSMLQCNDYLFDHSVTVFFFSMLLGISLDYEQSRLRELGIGALLHDTGMIYIPPDILNKPTGLTQEETEKIKEHPDLGFKNLQENGDVSLLAAFCALQHHERWDGSGYPKQLKQSDIHEFGQIVGLVDTYAAMTAKTPYRPAIPVYSTLAIIQRGRGTYFNPELVDLLTANLAVFPLGSVVKLNNRQIGIVTDYADDNKMKPIVRLSLDENHQKINRTVTIDVVEDPSIYIADVG